LQIQRSESQDPAAITFNDVVKDGLYTGGGDEYMQRLQSTGVRHVQTSISYPDRRQNSNTTESAQPPAITWLLGSHSRNRIMLLTFSHSKTGFSS